MYEKQRIPIERRNKLYLYLKGKLQEFGCPDSYLPSTAEHMVKDILKIFKLEDVGVVENEEEGRN